MDSGLQLPAEEVIILRNSHIAVILLTTGALVSTTGCATKKYVKNQVDPVSDRVTQVANQTNQQGQALDATRKDVERNEQQINAVGETAKAADARAGDALNAANSAGSKADQASAKADQANQSINELRSTVANLDDYKPATSVVVPFGFNKYALTPSAKTELDKLGESKDQWKRYFVAVEGFTDRAGSDNYNERLSKERADRVVQYLVVKYNIPVYRIHEIGLGKDKPADEGRGRQAAAKNRRVEVTVYTADAAVASNSQPAGAAATRQ